MASSPDRDFCGSFRREEVLSNDGDHYYSQDHSFSSPERSYDSNSNYSTLDSLEDPLFSCLSPILCNDQFSPSKNYFGDVCKEEHSLLLSPVSDDTQNAGSTWDSDPVVQWNRWNMDSPSTAEPDSFDFNSSFDFSPQKVVGSAAGYSPKQIELILNEASQVLGNCCLSDYN